MFYIGLIVLAKKKKKLVDTQRTPESQHYLELEEQNWRHSTS